PARPGDGRRDLAGSTRSALAVPGRAGDPEPDRPARGAGEPAGRRPARGARRLGPALVLDAASRRAAAGDVHPRARVAGQVAVPAAVQRRLQLAAAGLAPPPPVL